MAISKVAVLPHSPLLIPEIGRSNYNFLAKTSDAYQLIAQEIDIQPTAPALNGPARIRRGLEVLVRSELSAREY